MMKLPSIVDHSPEFLPVETILKEDEGNLSQSLLRLRGKECQREKQNMRMRVKRQDFSFKKRENEWQRNKMRSLRSDPQFREREKLKQRQRIQMKRLNPQYREAERRLQEARRRRKKIDSEIQAALEFADLHSRSPSPLQTMPDQLDCISHDVNLWAASQLPIKNGESEFGFFIHSDYSSMNDTISPYLDSKPTKIREMVSSSDAISKKRLDFNSLQQTNESSSKFQFNQHSQSEKLIITNHKPQNNLKTSPVPDENKNEKPLFICDICDKNFGSKASLNRHFKCHTDQFNCSFCDKVFRMKQHLNEHLKVHGEKKFICDKCHYKTCYKYALNRHNVTKHKYHHS